MAGLSIKNRRKYFTGWGEMFDTPPWSNIKSYFFMCVNLINAQQQNIKGKDKHNKHVSDLYSKRGVNGALLEINFDLFLPV